MSKVIILKGLPASGKSTWSREYMASHPNTKRVNKDDLRAMIDNGVWDRDREKFILQIRDDIILQSLKKSFDVIVDDTNLSPKHINRIKATTPNTAEIVINDEFLDVSLVECIQRDQDRENSVGRKVIEGMYNQFLSKNPMSREEKSQVWFKTFTDRTVEYVPYDVNLEDIIICDIDGTIALKGDRSPFDYTRVKEDLPHEPVIAFIKEYAYREIVSHIIMVSGREGTDQVRLDTLDWLDRYEIPYYDLLTRKAGDYRKDVIIKTEIYEEHIKGKYNVLFVLDDRNQTVAGWRKLGLPTFQVAEGDF